MQLFLGVLAAVAAVAATSGPGPRGVTGGSLRWRLSDDLAGERTRVLLSGGVVQDGGGRFVFPAVGGDYDAATGTATAKYGGSVTIVRGTRTLVISDPEVVVHGALTGVLGADAALAPVTFSLTYEEDAVGDVLTVIRGQAVVPCPSGTATPTSGTSPSPGACGTPSSTPSSSNSPR
ncbi:hypothetical protein C1I98_38830, partial [Spongiactinospora gelatinilytica]